MVIISKQLFYKQITDDLKCNNIHYWNDNCFQANAWFAYKTFLGSLTFFVPIYIIKAIIHRKKFKQKKFWKKLFMEELRSGCYGFLLGGLYLSTNCILCKLSGRLNYYNLGLLAGMSSGLSVLIETKENKLLDTLIFSNQFVESVLRNLDHSNILKMTHVNGTVLFMIVSGILMHLLQHRTKKFTNFWFHNPNLLKPTTKESSNCGQHDEPCLQYSINGLKKNFLLGYAFSIVRKLIPKMLLVFRKPSKSIPIIFSKDNLKFGAFIGIYVGVYRYIMCNLLNTQIFSQQYYGAIAGCLSGLSYSISPNLQVLCVGITTIFQIFYNNVLESFNVRNAVPQQLIYMITIGCLFHNAIFRKETCPPYFIKMLDTCSDKIFSRAFDKLIAQYIF